MNAIEIRNLSKSFRGLYALDGLNMTVPVGAIYGFIGENGSGKSTTEKLICGHLVPDGGEIKLFGKNYTDPGVRVRIGALIENAGCFPGSSVYHNLRMQAINLNLEHPDEEINRVLKIVRMEDSGDAMDVGIQFLRIVAPFYFVVSAKLVTDGVLRGSGMMRQFMVATFSDLILRVMLAKQLSEILGSVGIWLAWPIGWVVGTVLSLMFYNARKWNK